MDKTDGQTNGHREHNHNHVSNHHTQCTCGGDHDLESEEEEITYENPSYRWSSPVDGSRLDSVQKKLLEVSRASGKAPPPPASTASSADGYESFENTSNKKKRKIPLSGSSSVHQTSLSAEMANMGISSHGSDGTFDDANGEGPGNYHNHTLSPSSAGTGISGAGRGRYGRQASRSERRPLGGTSTSSLNGHPPNFSAKSRWGNWKGDGTKTSEQAGSWHHVARADVSQSKTETRVSSRPPLQAQQNSRPLPHKKAKKTSVYSRNKAQSRPHRRHNSPLLASQTRRTRWFGRARSMARHIRQLRLHSMPVQDIPSVRQPLDPSRMRTHTLRTLEFPLRRLDTPPQHLPKHLHRTRLHSRMTRRQKRHVLASPAKSTRWQRANAVSSKSTTIFTTSPPRKRCGSASSANTKTFGASRPKPSSDNTRSKTVLSDRKQRRSGDCWRKPR